MGTTENKEQKRSKILFLELPDTLKILDDFNPRKYFLGKDESDEDEERGEFTFSDSFNEHILASAKTVKSHFKIPKKFGIMTPEEILLRIFFFIEEMEKTSNAIAIGCHLCDDGVVRVVSLERNDHGWFFNCNSLALWLDCLDVTFRKKKKKK